MSLIGDNSTAFSGGMDTIAVSGMSLLPASTGRATGLVIEPRDDDEGRPTEILVAEVSFDAEEDDGASDVSEDENLDDADRLDPNDADIELGDDEFDPDDVHFQPDDFNFVPDFFNFDPDVLPNDHLTGNVLEPTEHDVLLGRGGNIYGRPGNTWYRQDLLPRFKELYDSERRENKRQIAIDAINAVTSSGRRFLKRNELEGWVMAPDAKIIDKVMGDLRKLR